MEVTNESRSFIIGKSSRISPSDLLVAIRKNNNNSNAESSFTLKPLESLNSTVQSREGLAMMSNLTALDDALSPKKKQKAVVFLEANEYSDQSQTFMDSSEILTNRPKKVPKGILVRKGVGKSLPITPLRPKQENLAEDASPTVQLENKKLNKVSHVSSVSQSLMQINKEIAALSQAAQNNCFTFSRPSRTLSFKQLGSNKEPLRDEDIQKSSKRGDGDFLNQNKSIGKFSLRREYSESSIKRDYKTLNYRLHTPNIPDSRSFQFASQNNPHDNSRETAKFFHKPSTSEGSRSKLSFLDKSPMQKHQPINLLESFNEGEMSSFSQFDSPSFQLRSEKTPYTSQKSLKDNYLFSNINLPFADGANQSRNGFEKSHRASESPVTDRNGGFSQRVLVLKRQEIKPSTIINSINQLIEPEKKIVNSTGRRNSQQKMQQISFLFNKQIVKYDLMKMSCEVEAGPNSNSTVDNHSYGDMNNEYFFISGGMDRRNYSISSSAFILDLATLKVEAMPSLVPGRHSHTTVPLKHKIFVFGGQSIENKVLHGCCVFNVRERVWYKIPSMKMERKNAQSIVNQKSGVVYLLGGTNQNGNEIKIIEKLDTNKLSWNMLRYDTSIGLNLKEFIIIKSVSDSEDTVWILSRSKVMHEGQLVYRLYSFDLQQEKFAQEVEFTYFTDEPVDFGFILNDEIHLVKKSRFDIVDVYLGNGRWIEKKF